MESFVTELLTLLFAALRSATPVLAVVLGEAMTQRSGVINLGVEGQMLLGAMTGFAVASISGDPWLGVLAACCAGIALSMVHAKQSARRAAESVGIVYKLRWPNSPCRLFSWA